MDFPIEPGLEEEQLTDLNMATGKGTMTRQVHQCVEVTMWHDGFGVVILEKKEILSGFGWRNTQDEERSR